jgi:adhesin HecA-like repeat protein
MKCNSTLRNLFALTFTLTINTLVNSQTTYVDNGSNNSYNLASGDSLYIKTGVYQGYIGQFDNGARITVAAGASFQPGGINNPRGKVKNLGTVKINNWFGTNGGFTVDNYGMMWFASGMQMNEGVQNWTNNYGATLKFDAGVTINATNVINKGSIISTGDVTLNSGSSLTNSNSIEIAGNYTVNGSSFTNGGKFKSNGVTFNSGTTFNNTCRMTIEGNFTSSAQNVFNGGLIWCSVAKGNSKITNQGTITNYAAGVIKSRDFYNSGTLSGSGNWYFTGYTENYGTVGMNGGGIDKMNFYDMTRTSSSNIFDVQYGNVLSSAKFTAQSAPDTIATPGSCSSEAKGGTLLPVKWEYFFVNLSDNTPVLTWAAEQDPGTVFTVQRSYDAANFTTIASIHSEDGKRTYKFEDKQVSAQTKSVYYRIRAVEPTGAIVFSETRTLMFATKTGVSVQVTPNPFTSQLNISYQSASSSKISIRVISMSGAVMASKTVNVSTGYNSIAITEAASLIKGIYLVQLISENAVIASERVVKQ